MLLGIVGAIGALLTLSYSVHHTWNTGGCCNTQHWAGPAYRTPDFYWCRKFGPIYSDFCVVVSKSSSDPACSLWNGKRVGHKMFIFYSSVSPFCEKMPEDVVGLHLFVSMCCSIALPFSRTVSKGNTWQLSEAKLAVSTLPSWGGELAWRTAHFTKQISFPIPGKAPFLSEAQNAWRELIIPVILFTPLAKTLSKMLWPRLIHIIGLSAVQRVVCDLCNFNTENPSDGVSVYVLFTYWYLASIQWASEWSHISSRWPCHISGKQIPCKHFCWECRD